MSLDLSWKAIKPGVYTAIINDVQYHYTEIVGLRLSYSIETEAQSDVLSEYLPLDAPKEHPRFNDTAKGKGRVFTLLGTTTKFKDFDDLAEKLLGLEVRLCVSTRYQDGLEVPKINSVTLFKKEA